MHYGWKKYFIGIKNINWIIIKKIREIYVSNNLKKNLTSWKSIENHNCHINNACTKSMPLFVLTKIPFAEIAQRRQSDTQYPSVVHRRPLAGDKPEPQGQLQGSRFNTWPTLFSPNPLVFSCDPKKSEDTPATKREKNGPRGWLVKKGGTDKLVGIRRGSGHPLPHITMDVPIKPCNGLLGLNCNLRFLANRGAMRNETLTRSYKKSITCSTYRIFNPSEFKFQLRKLIQDLIHITEFHLHIAWRYFLYFLNKCIWKMNKYV